MDHDANHLLQRLNIQGVTPGQSFDADLDQQLIPCWVWSAQARHLDINGPDQMKSFNYLAHSSTTSVAHLKVLTVCELANDENSEHHNRGNDIQVNDPLLPPAPINIDVLTWLIFSRLKSLSFHSSPQSLGALVEVAAAGVILPTVKSLLIASHLDISKANSHSKEVWYSRLFVLLPVLEEYVTRGSQPKGPTTSVS